jgi:hypothetical protein
MSTKTNRMGSVGSVKSDVKKAGQKAAFNPLMEALTRLGYGVRGVIYITIGLLALSIMFGQSGATADQQGAIAVIGSQPGGLVFLWVVLVGLVSYALWGVIRAVFDPLHKGNDFKGLITRLGFLISAASYTFLSFSTYSLITGAGQKGSGTQQSMGSIMSTTWGRWGIGLIGLAMIANGLFQIYTGFNASFDRQYKTYAMTPTEVKAATQLGRFGTAARGVVFAVVGGLLCLAAYESNPNQPVGFDAALTTMLRQPYGVWLLGLVAVGLVAFGLYSMLSAVWFRSRR